MSARYVYHQPTGSCMIEIDEGDAVPTDEAIEEAAWLRQAIREGDPRVELTSSDEHPGCLLAVYHPAWSARVA